MKKISLFSLMVFAVMVSVLSVHAANTNMNIGVTLINQNPDPVEPGKYVELRFQLVNNGQDPINNAIFQITTGYPFVFDGSDTPTKTISVSSSSKTKDQTVLFYKIKIDDNAVQQDTDINLKYSVDDGLSWVTLDPFKIRITVLDVSLLLDNVKMEPNKIVPGKQAAITFTVKNPAPKYVQNVRVKMDLTSLPITPVLSSNEKIVDRIDSHASADFSYILGANLDATSKIYSIPVSIKYLTDLGVEKSKNLTIGVPVYDEPSIFMNLEETTLYQANSEGNVVLSVSNTGTSKINFVSLKVSDGKDYSVISSSSAYLGNLASDDYQTSEFKIRTGDTTSDKLLLKAELTYKDSYNKEIIKQYELPIKLYTEQDAIKYGLKPSTGTNGLVFYLMLGLLLLVFWIAMLVNLTRSKLEPFDKVMWYVVVIFTFVLGALIYYIFGRKKV